MKKIISYIKTNIWVLYLFLFMFMVIRHAIIELGIGDDNWFFEQSKMGLIAFTKWRAQVWTSRNIIEFVMLILLNVNEWVWIILDSLMFVLIAHSMRKIISPNPNNDMYITLLIVIIIVLFPFGIFCEAGWYATTLNYVWPLAFGLYGLSYITRIITKENITNLQKILLILATIYATNQEQMCALYVGFYGLFIIYCLIKHIHIPIFVYVIIAISLIMLGYHALCPGNANRKTVETQNYYPEFASFSIVDKLFLGLITTVSIGLVNTVYVVYLWNVVLLYLIFKRHGDIKDILIVIMMTTINLVISIVDKFDSISLFNNMFLFFNDYLKIIKCIDYSQLGMYLIIGYFIVFILINLFLIKKYLGNKMFVVIGIILLAALCSRIILGFSASIFISGRRTFINSYFLILVAGLLCLNYQKIDNEM